MEKSQLHLLIWSYNEIKIKKTIVDKATFDTITAFSENNKIGHRQNEN